MVMSVLEELAVSIFRVEVKIEMIQSSKMYAITRTLASACRVEVKIDTVNFSKMFVITYHTM
jgi:hypothetical protein